MFVFLFRCRKNPFISKIFGIAGELFIGGVAGKFVKEQYEFIAATGGSVIDASVLALAVVSMDGFNIPKFVAVTVFMVEDTMESVSVARLNSEVFGTGFIFGFPLFFRVG
jgi:hypothetical protein